MRALHRELPDLRRDGRRERQPARADLPDARGRPTAAWRRAPKSASTWTSASTAAPASRPARRASSTARSIEPFKIALQQSAPAGERPSLLQRLILHHLFPYSGRVKAALAPARLLQRLGVLDWPSGSGLTRLLPPTLRRMQAMLPRLDPDERGLPEVLPPIGPKRARVALFLGCVADAMFPETNAATARVLQQNGCEVVVPREPGLLRRDPLSLGRRGAGAGAGPAEHGGV